MKIFEERMRARTRDRALRRVARARQDAEHSAARLGVEMSKGWRAGVPLEDLYVAARIGDDITFRLDNGR